MSIELTRKEFMEVKRLIIKNFITKTSALNEAESNGWIIEEQKKICPQCRQKELEKYQVVCTACDFDERS